MNSEEFIEFIKIDPYDENNPYDTSAFQARLSYSPGEHSVGTYGYRQCLDRVQYMIEIWHNQICCHPSFKNPDDDMDDIRGKAARVAIDLFDLFASLDEKQLTERYNQQVQ